MRLYKQRFFLRVVHPYAEWKIAVSAQCVSSASVVVHAKRQIHYVNEYANERQKQQCHMSTSLWYSLPTVTNSISIIAIQNTSIKTLEML